MKKVKVTLAVLGILFAFQAVSQLAINTSGCVPTTELQKVIPL